MKWILILATIISVCSCTTKQTDTDAVINLNDGKKWEINEEMRPFLKKGNDILSSYVSENKTDYKALAKDLKEQNTKLIKSCNMKGQSHDELHKWLHPHMKLIKDLGNAENEKEAEEIVGLLEESFDAYNKYFD